MNMKQKENQKVMTKLIKKNKSIIITFILVFVISLLFPFSGDDWQWKFQGWDTIKSFYANEYLNGRYLGNIFIVIMSKNSIIRGLFIAGILTAIVEIISRKTKTEYSFIWSIILLMPLVIFRQTIPWASGFTNYVISTLFLLIDIEILKKAYSNKFSISKIIFSSFLFYASCLFIENQTICLVLALFILNIMYFIKNKAINKSLIVLFFSTILGTITMFYHPAYFKVIDGTDGYRTFANGITGIFITVSTNLETTIHRFLIFESLAIMILITLLMFIYYFKNNGKYIERRKTILNLLFIYQFLYIMYSLIYHLNPDWRILLSYTSIFNTLISLIYCIVILISTCLIYRKKDLKELLINYISIIALVAPLCVVTPVGGRNFFAIYIIEVILVCNLYQLAEIKNLKVISNISKLTLLVLVTYYVSIYGYIHYVDVQRINYIKEQSNLGKTEIDVPYLPYKEYIHGEGNFAYEYYGQIYKIAYNLNYDIKFNFMSYDTWKYQLKN